MYYIGSKYVLLIHLLIVMSIALASYFAGHEIGFSRFEAKYQSVYNYASLLERENSMLRKALREGKSGKAR